MTGNRLDIAEHEWKRIGSDSVLQVNLPVDAGIPAYQLEMMKHGGVPGFPTIGWCLCDGRIRLTYALTSKQRLAQVLLRIRLSRLQLLDMLASIASVMSETEAHLLDPGCLILEPDWVHADADGSGLVFLYLPTAKSLPTAEDNDAFRAFLKDLCASHVRLADPNGDPIVQRLLQRMMSSSFGWRDLLRFVQQESLGRASDRDADSSGNLDSKAIQPIDTASRHSTVGSMDPVPPIQVRDDAGFTSFGREAAHPSQDRAEKQKREDCRTTADRAAILDEWFRQKPSFPSGNRKHEAAERAASSAGMRRLFEHACRFPFRSTALAAAVAGSCLLIWGAGQAGLLTGPDVVMNSFLVVMLSALAVSWAFIVWKRDLPAGKSNGAGSDRGSASSAQPEIPNPRTSVQPSSDRTPIHKEHAIHDPACLSSVCHTPIGHSHAPAGNTPGSQPACQTLPFSSSSVLRMNGACVASAAAGIPSGTFVSTKGQKEATVCLAEAKADDASACLVRIADEHGARRESIIRGLPFLIGRLADQVDLSIENPAVGKIHAALKPLLVTSHADGCIDDSLAGSCADAAFLLVDLNSRNGTFVNGELISPNHGHPVRYGDQLRFANDLWRLERRIS